jgi:hypothetical protein
VEQQGSSFHPKHLLPRGPEIFQTLGISFQADGQTVISSRNVMDYFFSSPFDRPVDFNSPPIAALIWMEDIGVVHTPFSVGTHTLKLDVKNTIAINSTTPTPSDENSYNFLQELRNPIV